MNLASTIVELNVCERIIAFSRKKEKSNQTGGIMRKICGLLICFLMSVSATSTIGADKKAAGESEGVRNLPIDVESRASNSWKPSLRYPDPLIEVLDPSFLKYRIFSAGVEMLATGFRWVEGPVWVPKMKSLLFSDIPNNRIMRWDEATSKTTVFRENANYANGNTVDLEGRLITCEHSGDGRRITRTEHNGKITILADRYEGKRFNSPNDIVCKTDGSIWFTDPPFGIGGNYEGRVAKPEQAVHGVYRIDGKTNKVTQVLSDLKGPNGLCFSPDEKKLFVIEARAIPNRLIWSYDVTTDGKLTNKIKFFEALNYGALDGMKCDVDGNIWAGWGSSGALAAIPEKLDGIICINTSGKIIGHIHLPERCENLCFGGETHSRIFMTACHSIYSIYVDTEGAENVAKAKAKK
jgi:gluconolactonase